MPSKPQLREHFRRLRDALSPEVLQARSEAIRRRVLDLPEVAEAVSVFVYASTGSEVQTYTLIEDLLAMGKVVAVPRIGLEPGVMEAVPIRSLKDLEPGRFNLLEPRGDLPPTSETPAMAFTPGLAFDPLSGHRLGAGAGYYDRYLMKHAGTKALGLALDVQLHHGLTTEAHDQPMAWVVTEECVWRCR